MTGVHVTEHGNERDPTVVLLHSSGQSGSQWRAYLEPLAELGWHTLALDFIGNGRSAPWSGPEPFNLRHDVDHVVSLLRTLEGRTCALVGHSYGGFVGLQALLEPSVEPAGAVLFEPGAWGIIASNGSEEDRASLHTTSSEWFSDVAQGETEAWMRQFVEYWGGPGAWEVLGSRGRAAMMRTARQTYAQARSLVFDGSPLAAYESLQVPIHVVTARHSPHEIRSICRLLAESSPRNTLTEVPGGHMTPVLDPATVIPVICSKLVELHTAGGR